MVLQAGVGDRVVGGGIGACIAPTRGLAPPTGFIRTTNKFSTNIE